MIISNKEKWIRKSINNDISLENGFCFIAHTGHLSLSSHDGESPARVLEDGKPLPGPANALHDDIRKIGNGRYSFWHDSVYFSTTDNSDALNNARVYEIEFPESLINNKRKTPKYLTKLWARFSPEKRRSSSESSPVNYIHHTASLEDVLYAVRIGQGFLNWVKGTGQSLENKTALEIGPGINFGSALFLSCFGAKVMVSDRFLARWDKAYHPEFYSMLLEYIESHMPEADATPIREVLKAGGYPKNVIKCYETPLEKLSGISDASIDLIFSVAVLEHIFDPRLSFENMARVSKPGAFGFHQVDFRDHRTMETPLEFLLMSEDDFAREFEARHGECGNRYRPWEYDHLFKECGFEIVEFQPNIFAKNDYVQTFIPRLRAAEASKYRKADPERLKIVSGLYSLRKMSS